MLILLDIDGVMVQARSWSSPQLMEDGFAMFNNNAVKALNRIISSSGATILLTTSHKDSYTNEQWIHLFANRGVFVENLDRLPPNTHNLSRKQEISNWFSTNGNVGDFVILDDDKSLNGLSEYLKSRLVLTKPLIGLNDSHIEESLRILNTPLELV